MARVQITGLLRERSSTAMAPVTSHHDDSFAGTRDPSLVLVLPAASSRQPRRAPRSAPLLICPQRLTFGQEGLELAQGRQDRSRICAIEGNLRFVARVVPARVGSDIDLRMVRDHPVEQWLQEDFVFLGIKCASNERGTSLELLSHGRELHPKDLGNSRQYPNVSDYDKRPG